ncbi:TPA: ABC transporter permease subunit [Escherichia coli]|nr:ABC transporter permease subunit [Escherichia coli]EED1665729.1 ABC transporter permease subunit [Escherichia coli]EEV8284150.1 ABC transporter permease subunit [Escherichia coli]EEV8427964.1 ABC transporter permease subunit [Escherichia coli]EEV8446713.1 ABC transporter permease subunit [Escherichia coli]
MTFWSILRQRCWGLVLVVAGVCVITFIISHLIPGDPARLLAGDRASDAIVENIRQQLGLDQPLYVQFYRYVSDLFHGDLGTSIRTGRPVLEELRIFFPATLELAFCALLLALLIGIPRGILSAVWRNRWLDHLVRIMAITGISTPAFWLGLGVIVLFYGHLQILPGGGRLDDWLDPPTHVTGFYLLDALLEGNGEVFFNALQHLITPQDIIAWTEGNALVATGSPFNPVVWKDKIYPIAQCNNAFIFPGIGLGVIASGASRITDEMLMSASETLAQYSPLVLNGEGLVLPELKDIQKVSRAIAFAVGKMAQQQGVAVKTSAEALQQAIDDNFWQAEYRDYRRTSI